MLSQTAEYALRAMASLAYTPNVLTPTPTLAERTKVPANYLAKVLQVLAGAGLISGRRGVGGGYRLSRPPSEIALLEVIRAVDTVERITECPLGLPNHGKNLCALHSRVDEAAKSLIELFGSATLQDLVTDAAPSLPLCDSEMTSKVRLGIERTSAGKG